MSITLGPQINQKFTKLLECTKGGIVTLVLVVGRKELFTTVSDKIKSKFKSDEEYVNPPKIIWFSTDEGKLLHKYGVTQWAPATQNSCNAILKGHLEHGRAFVFYRDDVTCNVFTADDHQQAVREICARFKRAI